MPRIAQPLPIPYVPQADEGVRRIEEERAEFLRYGLRASELEDEAAAADAELQNVPRRMYVGASESPLDAETDYQTVEVDEVAAVVER